ncbi:sulfatase family protein [Pontiella sulfatireligans]|uniref:Arylsulfatase n=1 Tax=Pontiella sulfatireligans TaxID=2750658 RepID=A0A6C2UMI4_9BACT|nr:sulfatase [Pontiella sulfatireligans]SPS74462.1 sulfatase S1_8 [Kiritimatiellales bacterium]VGO21338.1 Arylsulfatase [Pontiella sulfatireligans]
MRRRRFIQAGAVAAASVAATKAAAIEKPNILWLTCEDNNVNWVGCYGNPHADTPNIDQLAKDGFQYMHAYASAPVCAPSRSTWITGINAISMGTHPMRSRYTIPLNHIQYYPDHLRANGYYCGNDTKTDYNLCDKKDLGGRPDKECWDNPGKVDWEALKQNQPFFQVINSTQSHESKAFGDVFKTEHDPADTQLRKYHPDVPGMRENYAHYHDAMKKMDAEIGASLQALEDAGLTENTIVIHNSDHGGVMPRSKRYLFGSGLHCPLIIRFPNRFKHLWPAPKPGMQVDRLVSFVDMPKTWLSLTGSKVPDYMQGTVFLGAKAEPEKPYHFAFRGRMDERCENARAVCDKQFLYLRNYMPYAPWMQQLNYLWKMTATQVWEKHVLSGKASEIESRFFAPKDWTEELYDIQKDPDNVNNLIENPEYRQVAARMNVALRGWQEQIHDASLLPEAEMVKRATENNTTIYEMVRNPDLYNLTALLNAADLALEKDPANLPALGKLLKSSDCGLRYWGIVGCFLLNDPKGGFLCLDDDSHEVRAMAAWLLINTGQQEKGLQGLENLIREESYALLKVLNIIDWMGDDGKSLIPAVRAIKFTDANNELMQDYKNIQGYQKRLQEQLLEKYGIKAPAPAPKKKRKGKKA